MIDPQELTTTSDRQNGAQPTWHPTYILPNALSPQSQECVRHLSNAVSNKKGLRRFIGDITTHFSRFKDLQPHERLFQQHKRTISGLKWLNFRSTGADKLLTNADRNLHRLEACNSEKTCDLSGCPNCSKSRRDKSIFQAIGYICSAFRRNHEGGQETVLLNVTIANRKIWCKPLKDASSVLSGRRNRLRTVLASLSDLSFESGKITDVLASVDLKYVSAIPAEAQVTHASCAQRCEAECDFHIHALICFVPWHQTHLDVQGIDWGRIVQRELKTHYPPPFDIHVQELKSGLTREKLSSVGIRASDLSELAIDVAYSLAYQTKTTTLDQISSNERPLVQSAIGDALNRKNGVVCGNPILIRSAYYEDKVRQFHEFEHAIESQIDKWERSLYAEGD